MPILALESFAQCSAEKVHFVPLRAAAIFARASSDTLCPIAVADIFSFVSSV